MEKNNPIVPTELHGNWLDTSGNNHLITANSFSFSWSGGSFTFSVLSFSNEINETKISKEEFPSGYKLNGKILSSSGDFETTPNFAIGNNFSVFCFLNSTKDKMITDGNSKVVIFTKQ